jgi:hypothetical protein
MKIISRMWDSYALEIPAKTIPALKEDCSLIVKPENLVTANVQTLGIKLHTIDYYDGIADVKFNGTSWITGNCNLRPAKNKQRTTEAGMEAWEELCELVCYTVSQEDMFAALCMKAEITRAQAHISWLNKGLAQAKSEAESLEQHIETNMEILRGPALTTRDQHALAASLYLSGHSIADAVLAAMSLTC